MSLLNRVECVYVPSSTIKCINLENWRFFLVSRDNVLPDEAMKLMVFFLIDSSL